MADSPKPVESADALAAMADGANFDQKDPQAAVDPLSPDAIDAILATGQAVPLEAPPSDDGTTMNVQDVATVIPVLDAEARRATRAMMQQRVNKANAAQFKQFMIPLLLTVGVILLGLGVTAIVLSRSAGQPVDRFERTLSLPPWAMWLGVISLAVGGILLVGAWYFRSEMRELNRANRQ